MNELVWSYYDEFVWSISFLREVFRVSETCYYFFRSIFMGLTRLEGSPLWTEIISVWGLSTALHLPGRPFEYPETNFLLFPCFWSSRNAFYGLFEASKMHISLISTNKTIWPSRFPDWSRQLIQGWGLFKHLMQCRHTLQQNTHTQP